MDPESDPSDAARGGGSNGGGRDRDRDAGPTPDAADGDGRASDGEPSVGQLLRTGLDAAAWGVLLLGPAAAAVGVVGLAVGTDLVGFKRGLFLLGFLVMGGSLLALRPNRAWRRGDGGPPAAEPSDRPAAETPDSRGDADTDTDADAGLPTPLPASLAPDADHRSSWALRAFCCGVWALVASYVMEAGFGVVPT